MKCASLPSSYRNWTFFTSVCTRANFSPARKVSSTTAPVSRFFSFVRTKAPPLPGFTCWNSTMRHIAPRCSMCMPVLELVRADDLGHDARQGTCSVKRYATTSQLLREGRQDLATVLGDDDQILDAAAADARNVQARLDGDDVSRARARRSIPVAGSAPRGCRGRLRGRDRARTRRRTPRRRSPFSTLRRRRAPLAPARTAARPSSCACATSCWTSVSCGDSDPVANVLVQSER